MGEPLTLGEAGPYGASDGPADPRGGRRAALPQRGRGAPQAPHAVPPPVGGLYHRGAQGTDGFSRTRRCCTPLPCRRVTAAEVVRAARRLQPTSPSSRATFACTRSSRRGLVAGSRWCANADGGCPTSPPTPPPGPNGRGDELVYIAYRSGAPERHGIWSRPRRLRPLAHRHHAAGSSGEASRALAGDRGQRAIYHPPKRYLSTPRAVPRALLPLRARPARPSEPLIAADQGPATCWVPPPGLLTRPPTSATRRRRRLAVACTPRPSHRPDLGRSPRVHRRRRSTRPSRARTSWSGSFVPRKFAYTRCEPPSPPRQRRLRRAAVHVECEFMSAMSPLWTRVVSLQNPPVHPRPQPAAWRLFGRI